MTWPIEHALFYLDAVDRCAYYVTQHAQFKVLIESSAIVEESSF